MRHEETGLELLATTRREQLETIGNVERFALSWTTGYWHDTAVRGVHKCDNARPPATRYYRTTDPPAGKQLSHVATVDGVQITIRLHESRTVDQAITLPRRRDSWEFLSVHAESQKTFSIGSSSRALTVMSRCTECDAQRGFIISIWMNPKLTLGCFRCHNRVDDPRIDTTPVYNTAADVPAAHGRFRLDRVTMGKLKACVIVVWATCTGPNCGGYTTSFTPSKWSDMSIRLSCNKCARTKLSAEQKSTIKQRLLAGDSIISLVREYHVHKTTINKLRIELAEAMRSPSSFAEARLKLAHGDGTWAEVG